MTQAQISVQLYTVRDAIAGDLPGTLNRIAEVGFRDVELYGFVDRAAEYADALGAAGLRAPSAHARLLGADLDSIFTAARVIGVSTVIDPHIDEARWTSREDVVAIAHELNEVARLADEAGLAVGYHNHAFEFERRIDGISALEVFADALDPAVTLEIDTYWAAVGGEPDVPALLTRLGARVGFLHVKDGPLTKDDREQVAVGAGRMPVTEILDAAPHALRVIELDDFDGDVFAALAESHEFLTSQVSR